MYNDRNRDTQIYGTDGGGGRGGSGGRSSHTRPPRRDGRGADGREWERYSSSRRAKSISADGSPFRGYRNMRIKRCPEGWTIQREADYRAQHRDNCTRTLIGARLPRRTADIVKEAARRSGRSIYRFTVDALREEVQKVLGLGSFR